MILTDRVLLEYREYIISYKKGKLYIRKGIKEKRKKLCDLPYTRTQKFCAKLNLLERLFRLEPRFAMPKDDSSFYVSLKGCLYVVDIANKNIRLVTKYRKGMNNPLNPCYIKNLPGFEDGLYYGEYWGNGDKESVKVFHVCDYNVSCIYEFDRGTITHIHSIIPDYTHNHLLVLTGDKDNESGIWIAENMFKCVKKILGGSQQNRSCAAVIKGDTLYYATDTPLESNHIYSFDLNHQDLTVYRDIDGPCIYYKSIAIDDKEYYVMATSVEPDSAAKGKWHYRLTRTIGPGVKDNYTHIYFTDLDNCFFEIDKYKKDILPLTLFQFGNVRMPYQESNEYLYLSPQSVRHVDGKTIVLDLKKIVCNICTCNERIE